MAIENLVLVNPKSFPDKRATARAAGAVDVIDRAIVCRSLKEAINGCTFIVGTSARARGLPGPGITLRELGKKVWQELPRGNVAVVFGRESSGLSNAELDLCQYTTTIPANWEFGSLNIAAAVQVVCYEIFIETLVRAPLNISEQNELATSDELERFYLHLQEVLSDIEFLDPKQPRLLMRRLRHLYNRTHLTQVEVNVLRGILSCTQRSIKSK